jgi:uncharacterized protein
MQASMFNVRVPLEDRNEIFLMNTFTDAQLIVSRDVVELLDRVHLADDFSDAEREAIAQLVEQGFLVRDRAAEREDLRAFFREVREGTGTLKVTVLTTLQCNFACDYCIQGDHGDYNKHAAKMSPEIAARVCAWVEARMEANAPTRLILTFFGGEPLLNLPVLYLMAERLHAACVSRGVEILINIITNGLLLSREMVERLNPLGLNGIKITLDGDREAHDRSRPLRGGQGTFDRIIANTRAIADLTRVAIGGNFEMDTADAYPALLDFLAAQEFAPRLSKVTFKPVIRPATGSGRPEPVEGREKNAPKKGIIPLTVVGAEGTAAKPLNGACMTSAGTGVSRVCDTCNFVDEKMVYLREETKKRGFATVDGVHMGPCEIHKEHAYTIGPDGSLFACPGFAGEALQSTGHIDGRQEDYRSQALRNFERLAAWQECNDCAFIPVCAGGCTVAAHNELGDMHAPNCHKPSFEAGLISLAHDAARAHLAAAAGA